MTQFIEIKYAGAVIVVRVDVTPSGRSVRYCDHRGDATDGTIAAAVAAVASE